MAWKRAWKKVWRKVWKKALFKLYHRADLSDQKIIEEIMLQYHLSKEKAEEYVLTPADISR